MEDKLTLWRELLDQHPSVSPAAFRAAVYEMVWKHGGDFLPTPAVALGFLQAAQTAVERDEQRALPPPPKPKDGWDAKSGPEKVAFLCRHMAIGVLKGRGNPEPTPAEVAGMVRRLEERRFCQTTLERIAAGEAAPLAGISEGMTGRWPGAKS